MTGRTVAVTCMKNEGPFIVEWVAWHRAIGVDALLVYTNDCTDGTDALLDALAPHGVTRRDNPFRATGKRPQHAALAAASGEAVVQRADWILPIDVDEFVNVHVGQGHLADLRAAVPGAEAVSMTWRLFGNADRNTFDPAPVIAQFTRCAPERIRVPHQAWGFKTLFRNLPDFAAPSVHRPKLARGAAPVWVNGSGQPMPDRYRASGWRSAKDSWGYDLVTLNHYAVRSAESFLVKRDRGRVNHVDRDQGLAYWFRMNNNAEEDLRLHTRLPRLTAAMAQLLADPAVAGAHAACVAAHRDRIADLRQDPPYRALYHRLTSRRLQRLSRLHQHFGRNVFLQGPQVIPDTFPVDNPPDDAFFNPPRDPVAGAAEA